MQQLLVVRGISSTLCENWRKNLCWKFRMSATAVVIFDIIL